MLEEPAQQASQAVAAKSKPARDEVSKSSEASREKKKKKKKQQEQAREQLKKAEDLPPRAGEEGR